MCIIYCKSFFFSVVIIFQCGFFQFGNFFQCGTVDTYFNFYFLTKLNQLRSFSSQAKIVLNTGFQTVIKSLLRPISFQMFLNLLFFRTSWTSTCTQLSWLAWATASPTQSVASHSQSRSEAGVADGLDFLMAWNDPPVWPGLQPRQHKVRHHAFHQGLRLKLLMV
jgi:hypothetical protein